MLPVDVVRARKRIARYIRRTPLVRSSWASDAAGANVWLKLESQQLSNSFKSRGAFNAVMALMERGHVATRAIVTASAGNHGRALAEAAEMFALPLVVFTPANAPDAKLSAIRRHGADLRPQGRDYDDAERLAKAYAKETGAAFVSPYNDPDVIAGAATIALELVDERPDLEVVVVPIGGGGLIAGIGAALVRVSPGVRVIGVEAERSHAFLTSVRAGHLVEIVPGDTIADGMAGNPDPETITFEPIQQFVDEIVLAGEDDLERAIVGLVEHEHVIAEGAGAAAVAAILARRANVSGRRVAAIVTGANIDRARLARLLT